jgi:hypothetical protein
MIYTSPTRANELLSLGWENNPFVAWNNLGASATLGGSNIIAGGERANAVTGSTYDRWRPVSGGTTRTLSFDFGTSTSLNFAAIAAHNLSTLAGSIAVQRSSDNANWTDAGNGAIVATDNDPMIFRFQAQSSRYWRFIFSGLSTSALLSVGVAFMGNELVIPRRFYQGFSPVITPTEVNLQSNVSVGNELLGSSVIGRGSTLSCNITYLDPTFVRGTSWLAFQRHFNDGGGFFFGWRPSKYPQDGYYAWRNGAVIRPNNSGPRDLMDVTIEARIYNART